jgi:hypothetical protein
VDLHGNFGQPEFRCYLLVQETRRYQSKNFPLARGQGVEMCLQVRDNLVCVAPLSISLNRRHHSVQHLLVAKWLGQEIDRSALHGPDAHPDIAMAGHEDNRNVNIRLRQRGLKSRPLKADTRGQFAKPEREKAP